MAAKWALADLMSGQTFASISIEVIPLIKVTNTSAAFSLRMAWFTRFQMSWLGLYPSMTLLQGVQKKGTLLSQQKDCLLKKYDESLFASHDRLRFF